MIQQVKCALSVLIFCGLLVLGFSEPAYANPGLILRGVAKTIFSAFQIPASMMQDSTRVMFPFGLITGAVRGSVKTVVGTMSGAVDLARGGAPYAKYAAFLI